MSAPAGRGATGGEGRAIGDDGDIDGGAYTDEDDVGEAFGGSEASFGEGCGLAVSQEGNGQAELLGERGCELGAARGGELGRIAADLVVQSEG